MSPDIRTVVLEDQEIVNERFTIVAAVNSDEVLQQNLLRSPHLLADGANQLLVRRNFPSASLAYNSAIDEAEHDLIIFIHQDIYLPHAWFRDLRRAISILRATDPQWGVLGVFGSRRDAYGGCGEVYTTGRGTHGNRIDRPELVETLDEIVLIIRRASGLRFDSQLPHFHLYGPDLCLTARARGMATYAFQGFCVHNTNQLVVLPREYYQCYRYLRAKWAQYLPIYTSCMTITSMNGEFYSKRIVETGQRILRRLPPPAKRVDDPRTLVAARS